MVSEIVDYEGFNPEETQIVRLTQEERELLSWLIVTQRVTEDMYTLQPRTVMNAEKWPTATV